MNLIKRIHLRISWTLLKLPHYWRFLKWSGERKCRKGNHFWVSTDSMYGKWCLRCRTDLDGRPVFYRTPNCEDLGGDHEWHCMDREHDCWCVICGYYIDWLGK